MSFILGNIIFINSPLIFSFDLFAFLFYKCRPTSTLPLQFISPLAATSLLSPASLYFFPFLGFCCDGSRPLRESLLLRPWLWCADALRLLSLLAGPSCSSWGEGIVPSWASGAACIWHSIHRRIGYGPHQRFCVLFRPASPWPWPHKSFCPSAYANRCGDSLQDGIFRLI